MKTKSIFILLFILSIQLYPQRKKSEKQIKFEETMKTIKNFSKDYLTFSSRRAYGNITISSEELKGHNVFYVFGDSQCPPCLGLAKAATEAINTKRYEGKNIRFVFFAADNEAGLKRLANVHKLKFDYITIMPSEEMKETGLIYFAKPTYVLVDKTGKVVFKGSGFPDKLNEAKKLYEEKITPEINKVLREN